MDQEKQPFLDICFTQTKEREFNQLKFLWDRHLARPGAGAADLQDIDTTPQFITPQLI